VTDVSYDLEFAQLNVQQKQAVTHTGSPALVIAGAGSGKTRVATMRIAHLIREGVPAQKIIAVTFTNKAAKEMRERVHALIGSSVLVSTFHSLGARILREQAHLLDYPQNFAIYNEEESEKILKEILKSRSLKTEKISLVQAAISKIKGAPSLFDGYDAQTQSIFTEYQKKLKASGSVDFDDLIYLPLKLFSSYPETLSSYNERWSHILVDEYQDTSESQCQYAAALAGQQQNIFAVGDPDQSIYSWRGANITNILSFQDRFPGAQIIRLEQNYRSTNTILQASNAVIKKNSSRYEKDLWSERGKGESIGTHIAQSDRKEAEFVAETVQSLDLCLNNIAILYRTNAQSRSIEEQMLNCRIPYRIWGGTPFYSRKEIRDVVGFLQLASLPQDTIAFERSIKTIGHGIGAITISKIQQFALSRNIPIFTAAFEAVHQEELFTKKQRHNIEQFCSIISSLRQQLEGGSAYSLISSAIHDTGYLSVLEKDEETLTERKENLEQLLARAQEWDDLNEGKSPLLLIEELVLEGARDQKEQAGPHVTLATVHNAKGLEFGCIFLVGLEEDIFPHINAKKSPSDIEEERRLFYVGMTRAKERLFISASKSRFVFGGVRYMVPSRFLREIPKSHCTSTKGPSPYFPQIKEKIPPTLKPLNQGQVVLHPSFGIGRVDAIIETSAGKAYEVTFSNDSTKRKILAAQSPMKALR
jgi:DNA helicase-2/ATP-dependent DNA helicase PcrA